MIPGRVLHRLAAAICSAKSLERIVEPAIADLQREYADSSGRLFRRGRLLLVGYMAVWSVMIFSAADTFRTREDRAIAVRASCVAVVAMTAVTVLLMIPPLAGWQEFVRPLTIALIIPQAVPLAIPIGLVVGLAFGVRGRVMSGGAVRTMLLVAVMCSAISFFVLVWLLPAANQEFRQQVFSEMGNRGTVPKGLNEMTFRELEAEIAMAKAIGNDRGARSAAWAYHLKPSLASAPFLLALLALSTAGRGRALPRAFILFSPVAYWLLMFAGQWLAIDTSTPPSIAAWCPNIVFLATALFIASSPSSRPRGSIAAAQ